MSVEQVRSSWQSRCGAYTTEIGWYNARANPKLPIGTCPSLNSAAAIAVGGQFTAADFYFLSLSGFFSQEPPSPSR
jgi:hypothetical protein